MCFILLLWGFLLSTCCFAVALLVHIARHGFHEESAYPLVFLSGAIHETILQLIFSLIFAAISNLEEKGTALSYVCAHLFIDVSICILIVFTGVSIYVHVCRIADIPQDRYAGLYIHVKIHAANTEYGYMQDIMSAPMSALIL